MTAPTHFTPLPTFAVVGGAFYVWRIPDSHFHALTTVIVEVSLDGERITRVYEPEFGWRSPDRYEEAYQLPWMCEYGEWRGPYNKSQDAEKALG